MPKHLICDTNVYYNIGANALSVSSITQSADEIIEYSPITPLEIAGKRSLETFSRRRDAASAILSSGALELPDTDLFLTRDVFGYTAADEQFSFADGVKAMAQATDMQSLIDGVADLQAGLLRKVSVAPIHQWRRVTEEKWRDDMLKLQCDTIRKFAAWYDPDPLKRRGPVPRLKGKEKDGFLNDIKSQEWLGTVIVACQERALLGAKRDLSLLPSRAGVQRLCRSMDAIACYAAIYTRYLIRLMTEGALPEPNDSGDIELFLYSVDDDHVVVTSEKKWRTLAELAGFGARVRLV